MCDEQKKLLKISLVDAAINLTLSILLAIQLGVLGVALGTLSPTFLVGWLWVVPATMRKLEVGFKELIVTHAKGMILPMAVFGAVIISLQIALPAPTDCGLLGLAWRGLACMIPFLFLARKELLAIIKQKKG